MVLAANEGLPVLQEEGADPGHHALGQEPRFEGIPTSRSRIGPRLANHVLLPYRVRP